MSSEVRAEGTRILISIAIHGGAIEHPPPTQRNDRAVYLAVAGFGGGQAGAAASGVEVRKDE